MEFRFYRGRVALAAILRALGIGAGDEVAVQAFTCVAVPEGVMATGARPVYVDIERNGFNLDVDSLRDRVSGRTRAIVVQHTFGLPARMEPILALAAERRLPVIEDCCHSLESRYESQRLGTLGTAAFYSFEWGKPVVIGIGGAARANVEDLREGLNGEYRRYVNPPQTRLARLQVQYLAHRMLYRPSLFWPVRRWYRRLGRLGLAEQNYHPIGAADVARDFRWRMAPALGRRLARKLQDVPDLTSHARRIAEEYQTGIAHPSVRQPEVASGGDPVFCRFPLRVADKAGVLERARAARVELADWYHTPVHPLSEREWPLVHYRAGSCPEVEKRCAEVVTLPTGPTVTIEWARRAVAFVNAQPR